MKDERRRAALIVACPKCGSPPNVRCSGKRGPRAAPHLARLSAAPSSREISAVAVSPRQGDSFYRSDAWRVVRYEALRRSRGVCECCGSGPAPGRPLHVDHIQPRSLWAELTLTLSNLQVLCADCNLGKGNTDKIDWRELGAES